MPNAPHTSVRAATNDAQSGSDALYAAAVMLWRERRRDEAIKHMDEALRLKPDFAAALCMGGYMLSECGKPEPAMRFYRRALELDGSLGRRPCQLRQALVSRRPISRRRSLPSQRRRRSRLMIRTPGAAAPELCARLGRLEELLEAAERALELRHDFPEAAINLGNALLEARSQRGGA